MKKKHVGTLLAAAGLALAPMTFLAPSASADICAGAHGRFVGVEGCGAPIAHIATGAAIAGGVAAGVAIDSAAVPYVPGRFRATPSKACRTTPRRDSPAD